MYMEKDFALCKNKFIYKCRYTVSHVAIILNVYFNDNYLEIVTIKILNFIL